jgi:hypothetical protein
VGIGCDGAITHEQHIEWDVHDASTLLADGDEGDARTAAGAGNEAAGTPLEAVPVVGTALAVVGTALAVVGTVPAVVGTVPAVAGTALAVAGNPPAEVDTVGWRARGACRGRVVSVCRMSVCACLSTSAQLQR